MAATGGKLGIIAGGGRLPVLLAEGCRSSHRPFFIVGLEGYADADLLEPYPHDWSALGTVDHLTKMLKKQDCVDLVMAGIVKRPDFAKLKLDWRGSLLLPKILKQLTKGDDSLFKVIVEQFEKDGFKVIGVDEVLEDLLAPVGVLGKVNPSQEDEEDIRRAGEVVTELGKLDIGQGAVVCHRLVLAVEAAEGTDKMLDRCAGLPPEIRGTADHRRGVLLKMPKPGQERRVDLPTVGVQTVEKAAAAGLAGIAMAAGASLLMDREKVIERADALGLFVVGLSPRGLGAHA